MEIKKILISNADDTELMHISREGLLSLNLAEMQAIQPYFAKNRKSTTRCRA